MRSKTQIFVKRFGSDNLKSTISLINLVAIEIVNYLQMLSIKPSCTADKDACLSRTGGGSM